MSAGVVGVGVVVGVAVVCVSLIVIVVGVAAVVAGGELWCVGYCPVRVGAGGQHAWTVSRSV